MTADHADDRPRVLVLGPLDLRRGDISLGLGAPRVRALLALLALSRGQVCAVTSIIDQVWGEDPPATVVNAVQVYVAGLRKSLAPAGLDSCLVTQPPGYRLILPAGSLDLEEFEDAHRRGRQRAEAGDHQGAAAAYRAALDQWRGPALDDLDTAPFAANERTRLEEQRLLAELGWLRALLELGHHEATLPHLEQALSAHPLHENLWSLRATALYLSGRQSDALAALRRARRLLDRELGVQPGPELVEVERQILAHDPHLSPRRRSNGAAGRASAGALAGVAGSGRHDQGSALTHVATSGTTGAALVLPDGSRTTIGRGTTVLGRHADCDVVLDHRDVSRRHARISAGTRAHEVEDLGSTNGTAVNGDLLRPGTAGRRTLGHGDRVEIGPLILRYEAGTPG